jgi:hypothetical protein
MCWIPHEHTFTLVSHSEKDFLIFETFAGGTTLNGVLCALGCNVWIGMHASSSSLSAIKISVGDARSVSLDLLVEKCPWILFSTSVKFDKILSLFSRSFRQVLHNKFISPLAMFLKRVVSVHFQLFGRLLNSFEAVFNTDSFPLMINLFLGTELFKHNMQMSSIWIPFTLPFSYPAILNFKNDLHHVLACIIYIKL